MAKIQIKNSFITSSADITISSSLVRFSGGISAKNITGSFSGSIPQLSSYFKQGGNSFGTTATLGTNDNQALIFETNGSTGMYISGSGNVGIGTTSPASKLSIAGSSATNFKSLILRNGDGTIGSTVSIDLETSAGTIGDEAALAARISGIRLGGGTTGGLVFATTDNGNLGERVRILNNGNVGIGTTSPAAKLYVVSSGGPIARFDGSSVASSGATEIDVLGPQSNGDLNLGIGGSTFTDATNNIQNKAFITAGTGLSGLNLRSDAGYVQITTGGLTSANERMRITSDGKVGIGTSSPVTKFQVSGSATIGGYNTFYFGTGVTSLNITAPLYPVLAFYYGTNFAGTVGGYSDHIGLNTGVGASKYISFEPNDAEAMRITAAGNVGIGTSSPARKLHVYVTTGPVMRLQTSGSNASIEFAPSLGTSNNRYNWLIGAQQNISDAFEITPSTAANGSTFSTPAILVASSGNIGIGTTSPTQRLDLSGSLRIRSAGTYSDPTDNAGFINYDSTGGIFTLSARSNGGNTYMAFRTSNAGAAGERMRIINDGNVGIGTTAPAYKLDVVGDIHASSEMYLDNGYYLRFKRSSGGVSIQTLGIPSGTDDVQLLTSGDFNILNGSLTNLMTVKNGGNVGIGTTSPVAKLHVTGSSSIPAALLIGNVGIGTTSPTYKLNVVTTAVSGRQTLTNIDKTAQNLITFTNPQYSVLSSMGLMLRVYPQSDSRQGAGILASGGAFNGDTDLDLFVSSGSAASTTFSALKINARGSVGIGTTSPGNKLSVISGSTRIASAALDGALYLGNDGNNIYLQRDNNYDLSLVQNGDSNRALYLASAGSVYVNIDSNNNDTDKAFIVQNNALKAGTELFRVSETGYVGIGTSSPANRLDIWGATGTTFNMANTDDSGRGGKLTFISSSATGRQFYVGTNSSIYNLVFGIDSIEKARINTNGNLGIGTTAPAYKLDVSGSISADAFLGKSFGMTGTSGSTAIYDTFVTNGTGEVYELMATGNPNSAGSGYYKDVMFGKIIIGTGWNGSATTTYINYVQENPDPRLLYPSGGSSLSASICFKSGSSEVSNKPVLQYTKIRVKIGSYQTGYVGNYTTVRVKKLL